MHWHEGYLEHHNTNKLHLTLAMRDIVANDKEKKCERSNPSS